MGLQTYRPTIFNLGLGTVTNFCIAVFFDTGLCIVIRITIYRGSHNLAACTISNTSCAMNRQSPIPVSEPQCLLPIRNVSGASQTA